MKTSNSFTAMLENIYVGTVYATLTADSNSVFSKISRDCLFKGTVPLAEERGAG
jgi:hypothetical protein